MFLYKKPLNPDKNQQKRNLNRIRDHLANERTYL